MRATVIWLVAIFSAHAGEIRTWTDNQDRQVEAEMIRIDAHSVILRLKDGRELPFPLAKLSAGDVQHIEKIQALPDANPAVKLNFDDPWPERIKISEDPEVTTVEENAEKTRFVYESANYQYICDVRLSQSVVKGFAVMFEATYLFCRTIPLALTGGRTDGKKHEILLFETYGDYIKAGGLPGSGGVFISGRGVVMVPLENLGVKPVGSGYMLDRDKTNEILAHELTHQLTPECYYKEGAMGWFSEGLAEYVATTPYRSGAYNLRGNQRAIFDYVTAYGSKDRNGRALGTKINLPHLKSWMLQDYASFLAKGSDAYGHALLITNYFLHLDGAGDGKRIKDFLKALHDGKKGEEALLVLLDGRTFEELQHDIIKGWASQGIDFAFANP